MRKLNNEKTELLLLNARHRPLSQLTSTYVGTELIVAADSAKTIGIWFDNNLSMNKHVKFLCKTAFYHLRNLVIVRRVQSWILCKARFSVIAPSLWNNLPDQVRTTAWVHLRIQLWPFYSAVRFTFYLSVLLCSFRYFSNLLFLTYFFSTVTLLSVIGHLVEVALYKQLIIIIISIIINVV